MLATFIVAGGFMSYARAVWQHPLALITLALYGFIALGMLWSTGSNDEAIRVTEKHARILLAVFAIALLPDATWRRRALVAWLAAILLTLFLSYVHSVWAFPLARATRENALGDHYIFKHHITQNVMMSVFAAASLCEAVRAKKSGIARYYWAWIAIAGLATMNVLFLVAGRTGYLTLIASLVIAALVLSRGRMRYAICAALIAAVAVLATSSDTLRQRVESAVSEAQAHDAAGEKTSVGMRVEFAQRSLELIEARPVFGYGTGSYSREFCRVAASVQWCRVGYYNPHNQFLFFGVQLGVVGVLLFCAWIGVAAWVVRKAAPVERAVGFALVVTLAIHSLLDSPLYIVTEGAWYPLMIGILAAGYRQNTTSAKTL